MIPPSKAGKDDDKKTRASSVSDNAEGSDAISASGTSEIDDKRSRAIMKSTRRPIFSSTQSEYQEIHNLSGTQAGSSGSSQESFARQNYQHLHLAIEMEDEDQVLLCLKGSELGSQPITLQILYLRSALRVEAWGIVHILIRRGIDVNIQLDEPFGSALAAAAAKSNVSAIQFLLEAGADVDMQLKDGTYGSALAAASDSTSLELLIQAGADVNMRLQHGLYGSALVAAARISPLNVSLLIQAGADVNMPSLNGRYGSALVAACASDFDGTGIINTLIESGAHINMRPIRGHFGSALAAALSSGKPESFLRFLLRAGADLNIQLQTGAFGSALVAAVWCSSAHVRLLLRAGANVNMQLDHGIYGSALIAACASDVGNTEMVNILIEAGAEINMRPSYGGFGSALAAAVLSKKNVDFLDFLINAGAEVDMKLTRGGYGSSLAASVATGDWNNVQTLITAGAEVNMQLEHGDFGSALSLAISKPVLTLLLDAGANVDLDLTHGSYQNALSAVRNNREHIIPNLLYAGAAVGPLSSQLIEKRHLAWSTQLRPSIGSVAIITHTFGWEVPDMVETNDILSIVTNMGTLTRMKDTVALATGHDFILESYGAWGLSVLRGVVRALKSSCQLYEDGNLQIKTSASEICLLATDATPDARPILEWICLTFRKPILHTLCLSKMSRIDTASNLNDLIPFRGSAGHSECWHNLFDSGIVSYESTNDSTAPCRGLELDFKQLVRLSAVEYPVLVDSGLILMGYSTALIPVELSEDGKIMWHLEVAKDDFQLQVSDLKAPKKQWLQESRFEILQGKTAVLGWCSEAEVLLGTDRLKPTVTLSDSNPKPVSWRWGGANLQLVAQSASPLALGGQLGFSFERCINTMHFSPSKNYLNCLSTSARQPIVLYDVMAKRAWLVSLVSVFHHMLLSWSEQVHERFRKSSPPTASPGPDCGLASQDALRDQGGLILDSSGDDVTTVRDLIMGFSINMAKVALQAPRGSKIYGYEFMDIAMESPKSELKKMKLKKEGLGWIPLLDEIKCLFCSDLGDAIMVKRSPSLSSPCNSLIEGYDLMAASIQSINALSQRYGDKNNGSSRRLSQTHFWRLVGSPFQDCQHDKQVSCWNHPEALGEILQEIKSRQPSGHSSETFGEPAVNGALVFGGQARSIPFFHRAQSAEKHTVTIKSWVKALDGEMSQKSKSPELGLI